VAHVIAYVDGFNLYHGLHANQDELVEIGS